MTKTIRRILSLVFALMLFASVAAQASALNSVPAGIYIFVGGSCELNDENTNDLNTNTFVKINPDQAYLVTKVKFSNGLIYTEEESASSQRNAKSFDATFTVYQTIDLTPTLVYSTHEVRGGRESDWGYAYYATTGIDLT